MTTNTLVETKSSRIADPMKILVADDDNLFRFVLAATLKKLGNEVVVAGNGLAAWEAFQKNHFSMVILDWLMPGLDGLALCRQIRTLPRENYTYIILLTALKEKSSHLEAMEAGADDFMTKPFDADQLTSRLHVAERILELQRRVTQMTLQLREKSDRMEEELKLAHQLQLALLPKHFPGIPRGSSPTESAVKCESEFKTTSSIV